MPKYNDLSNGSEQTGMSNMPSSVVELIPNQRDQSPEVGPSNGSSAPPEPRKMPLAEVRHNRVPRKIRPKRVPGRIRIKVVETYFIKDAISKNGNRYNQVGVRYVLLSSMEEQVKRTADYTEEADRIFEAELEADRIYEVQQRELEDGFLHWTAINPVPPSNG